MGKKERGAFGLPCFNGGLNQTHLGHSFDELLIEFANPKRHRTGTLAITNLFTIDFCNWRLGTEGSCQKYFTSRKSLIQRIIFLIDRDIVSLADINDFLSGNTLHAIVPCRGLHLTFAYNEEVTCIGSIHKAVGIEHQTFISSNLLRLNAGKDATQL